MAVAGARFRCFVALLVGLGALAVPAVPASAATTRTWVGPGDGLWSNALNWSPAGAPQNGDSVSLGSSSSAFDMPGLSIGDMQIAGGLLRQAQGAGPLTLSGDLIAGSYEFVQVPLVLAAGTHDVSVAAPDPCCQYLQIDRISGPGTLVAAGPGRIIVGDASEASGTWRATSGARLHIPPAPQLGGLELLPGSQTSLVARQPVSWPVTVHAGPGPAAELELDSSSADTSGFAGPVSLQSDLRLQPGLYDSFRFTGVVSGSGGLIVGPSGSEMVGGVELAGVNTYSGGTVVEAGGRVVGSGSAPFASGPIAVQAGGRVVLDGVPALAAPLSYVAAAAPPPGNHDTFLAIAGTTVFSAPVQITGGGETYINLGGPNTAGQADVEFGGSFSSTAQLGIEGNGAVAFSALTSLAHLGAGLAVDVDLRATAGSAVVVGDVWTTASAVVNFRRSGQHDPSKSLHVFAGGAIDLWGTDQAASTVQLQHGGWLYLGLIDDDGVDPSRLTVNGAYYMSTAFSGDLGVTFVLGADGSDQIRADSVALGGEIWFVHDGTPRVGRVFRIIDNVGAGPVQGTFADAPEGTVFTAGAYLFRLSYVGGTGNDVTLTRLPGLVSTWGYDEEPHDHAGYMQGAPSLSSWGAGRVDGWIVGADRQTWHRWQSGGSGAWEPLGGISLSTPAGVSQQPGQADVFVRGADNALWFRSYRTGWGGWQSLGGTITEAPAVTSPSPGNVAVVGRGADGGVWLRRMVNGAWQPWFALDGRTDNAPAITDWGDGRLDVWIRGLDGALWQQTVLGGSALGWQRHGGVLTDGPAVASSQPGDVLVLVRGGDGLVYERSWEGTGWTDWRGFDLPVDVRPALTGAGGGDMYLGVRSPTGSLWTWHVSQDWSTLASAGDAGAATAGEGGTAEVAPSGRGGNGAAPLEPAAPT
jgi:hypothetical protein